VRYDVGMMPFGPLRKLIFQTKRFFFSYMKNFCSIVFQILKIPQRKDKLKLQGGFESRANTNIDMHNKKWKKSFTLLSILHAYKEVK